MAAPPPEAPELGRAQRFPVRLPAPRVSDDLARRVGELRDALQHAAGPAAKVNLTDAMRAGMERGVDLELARLDRAKSPP